MLICSQCRFENPPSNRFCQVCGSTLPEANEAAVDAMASAAEGQSSAAVSQSDSLELPSSAATEKQQFRVIEAFATVPPSQVAYHESLPDSSSDAIAEPPAQAATDAEQGAVAPANADWDEKERSEDIAEAAPAKSDEANTSAAAIGETWEESTVWNGSEQALGDDDSPTVVLPMQLARLDSAGASHVGRQRDHNEDNFSIQTEIFTASGLTGQTFSAKGLYILCDGMGGHSGGEVASAMVVDELKRYFAEHWQEEFPSEEMIRAAIASANQAVYDANEGDDRLGNSRMGTTLVLVLIQENQVAFAHVGDSRLYTYSRRQGLIQRTVDHEVGQLEVMRGVEPEIAYGRPESYQLTQALGPKDSDYINPGLEFMELQEDTLFLLCSDGLSDYSLVEDHGEEKVAPLLSSQAVLEQGVSDLVHLANELSGHDNITAVVIRAKVRPDSKALAAS